VAVRRPLAVDDAREGHRPRRVRRLAPTLAFEGFEATVRQVAGSVLRDERLVEEGRLIEAKVARLRKAVELETEAEQRRREADAKLVQRRQADAQARARVERETEAREQAVQQEKTAKERAAAETAAAKERSARKADAARKKVVGAQERSATAARLDAERDALTAKRQSLAATGEVLHLDDAIEASKASRKRRSS